MFAAPPPPATGQMQANNKNYIILAKRPKNETQNEAAIIGLLGHFQTKTFQFVDAFKNSLIHIHTGIFFHFSFHALSNSISFLIYKFVRQELSTILYLFFTDSN